MRQDEMRKVDILPVILVIGIFLTTSLVRPNFPRVERSGRVYI